MIRSIITLMKNIILILKNIITNIKNFIKKFYLSLLAIIILITGIYVYFNVIKSDSDDSFSDYLQIMTETEVRELINITSPSTEKEKNIYAKRTKSGEILSQNEFFQSQFSFNINPDFAQNHQPVSHSLSDNFILRFDKIDLELSRPTIKRHHTPISSSPADLIPRSSLHISDPTHSFSSQTNSNDDLILNKSVGTPVFKENHSIIMKVSHNNNQDNTNQSNTNRNIVKSQNSSHSSSTENTENSNQTSKTQIKTQVKQRPQTQKRNNRIKKNTVKSQENSLNETSNIEKSVDKINNSSQTNAPDNRFRHRVPDSLRNLSEDEKEIDRNMKTIYDIRRR